MLKENYFIKDYTNDLRSFSNSTLFDLEKPIFYQVLTDIKTTAKSVLDHTQLKSREYEIFVLFKNYSRYTAVQITKWGEYDTCYANYMNARWTYTKAEINDARRYCDEIVVIAQRLDLLRQRKRHDDDLERKSNDEVERYGDYNEYDHSNYRVDTFRYRLKSRLQTYKANKRKEEFNHYDTKPYMTIIKNHRNTISELIHNLTISFTTYEDLGKLSTKLRELSYDIDNIDRFLSNEYTTIDGFNNSFKYAMENVNEAYRDLGITQ